MLRSINLPLVYDFFPTSALNTCQKFARLEARAKLWHLLGHSGKLLTITKAIEVIFSAAAAVLGSRSPAKTANALFTVDNMLASLSYLTTYISICMYLLSMIKYSRLSYNNIFG